MKSLRTAGLRRLQKGLIWLLAAILLVTMLPLAGIVAGQTGGDGVLSAFKAFADEDYRPWEEYDTYGHCGFMTTWSYDVPTRTLTVQDGSSIESYSNPDDYERLGEGSFRFPTYIVFETDKIVIKPPVAYIGNYAFTYQEEVKEVVFPNTLRYIGEGAFQDCYMLKKIDLPAGTEKILKNAFTGCDALSAVTLPEGLTELDPWAFLDCPNLKKISVSPKNETFKDIDGVVYSKDGKNLLIFPSGRKDHFYDVPEGVTPYFNSFYHNRNLRGVSLPEGTELILGTSFKEIYTLKRLSLPASLKQVAATAFEDCRNLEDVYFAGTEEQWNAIEFGAKNEYVQNATIHFQAGPEDYKIGLFEDVSKTSWFYDHVIWAASKNITTGTSDITFSPTNPCVRAQMVTFLWRAAGEPEPASMEMKFTDVPKDAYYAKAVAWAVENNITQGMSETAFSPNGKLERGQTVTFLYRWANPGWAEAADDPSEETEVTNPFEDIQGDEYYAKAVFWAVKNNITQGMTPTTFAPKAICDRAQIVTFLHRANSES